MTQPPDPSWIAYQRQMDDNNLSTLVLLHRIWGGFQCAIGCCFVGYITVFLGLFGAAAVASKEPAPGIVGLIFGSFWGIAVLFAVAVASLNFFCANWIRDRRNWTGVVIVSALNCLSVPLGLALAVFTLIVITRVTVKETFA